MDVKLTRVSNDARGEIYSLGFPAGSVVNIQTTNAGYARGGHSHSYDEVFLVVSGRVEYHSGTVGNERVRVCKAGSVIRTTPGEPHYILAQVASVLAEVRPSGTNYVPKNYKPFRKIVLALMTKKS